MDIISLNKKIKDYKDELIVDIEKFVKKNAKFSVGDIFQLNDNVNNYYVITQVGWNYNKIGYHGNKLVKSRCEVSNMNVFSGLMVNEYMISKSIFHFKGEDIKHIEKSNNFKSQLKIQLNS